MRTLMLMRHAKSSWDMPVEDFDRPLAKRGRRDAGRMGKWLLQRAYAPDRIVSSPARRAQDTACAICEQLGLEPTRLTWDGRVYEASVATLAAVTAELPEHSELALLVGHNPGLELFISYLTGGAAPDGAGNKLMPTAAVAVLRLPGGWDRLEAGCADWLDYMRPKLLV